MLVSVIKLQVNLTNIMSLPIEDITEDIPCPWYKCHHILSRLQFKSHFDKHREDIATHPSDNQNDGEMLNTDNCDIIERRSESLTQRMLSITKSPSQTTVRDNNKLMRENFRDLLFCFNCSTLAQV